MRKYLINLIILTALGIVLFFIQKKATWSEIKLGGKIFLVIFDLITISAIVETIVLMTKKMYQLIFTEKLGNRILKIPIVSQTIFFFGLLIFLIRKIKM